MSLLLLFVMSSFDEVEDEEVVQMIEVNYGLDSIGNHSLGIMKLMVKISQNLASDEEVMKI